MAKIDDNFRWDAYTFIIKPWRDSDAQGMLERFCGAIQEAWETTQGHIDGLGALSDVDNIPDEFLTYLKWHLGWTAELDYITKDLTADELRKLIRVSASIWKQKGTQKGVKSAVRLLTGAEAIIWNWFFMRWLVDSTDLWYTLNRLDSWVTGAGHGDFDEYMSIVYVQSASGLNYQLIRDIMDLNRPAGEAFLLAFPDFVDDFGNGLGQWNQAGTVDGVWDTDTNTLQLPTDSAMVASIADTSGWDQAYIVFQANTPDSAEYLTLEFMRSYDGVDCFVIQYSPTLCRLYIRAAGVLTSLLASGAPDGWVAGNDVACWARTTWESAVEQRVEVGVGTDVVLSYVTTAGTVVPPGGFAILNGGAVEYVIDRLVAYKYPVRYDVITGPGTIAAVPPTPVSTMYRAYTADFGDYTASGSWWHTTTYRRFTSAASMYFGTGESGDSGSGTAGDYVSTADTDTVTSANIDLSAFNATDHVAYLQIWQYLDVRSGSADDVAIEVLVDSVIVQTIPKAALVLLAGNGVTPMVEMDSSVLGSSTVQVQFRFDIVSTQAGSEEGWFVDDVGIFIDRT